MLIPVFSSRSLTYYSLVGVEVIKATLIETEEARERSSLLPTLGRDPRRKCLSKKRKLPPILFLIIEKTWDVSRDIREAVRMGKICRNRGEVNQGIKLIRKYGVAIDRYNIDKV